MPTRVLTIALFLTSVALMIVVGAALQSLHPQYGLIASELVCILLPALVTIRLMARDPELPAPLRFGVPQRVSTVLWIIVTSALLGFAANAMTGILAETIPALKELATAYEEMFQGLMFPESPLHRAAAIAAICVVAPLCEEVLFRGVMLPIQLESGGSLAIVLLINGLLFSLLHMNPLSFLALIVVGAFFAHLAVLTRSLWAPVLAHATLNFANGVVGPMVADASTAVSVPTLMNYAVAVGVLTPMVVGLWIFGARRLLRPSGRKDA